MIRIWGKAIEIARSEHLRFLTEGGAKQQLTIWPVSPPRDPRTPKQSKWPKSDSKVSLGSCDLGSSKHHNCKYRGGLGLRFSNRSGLRPVAIWACGYKPRMSFPLGNRLRFQVRLELRVTLRPKSLAICGCGWKATKATVDAQVTQKGSKTKNGFSVTFRSM